MGTNIDKVARDIKSIKIQGATNIAKASIGALFNFSKKFKNKNKKEFLSEIKKNGRKLAWARPDEPLNQNIINYLIRKLEEDKTVESDKAVANFQHSCRETLNLVFENEKLITKNGIKLIKDVFEKRDGKEPVIIFTYCNSSSVSNILIGAHKSGIPIKVYNSETRPKFQGRILAKNLVKKGIDLTMTVDSAMPFLISKINQDNINADMIIIGVDMIALDGSALNKVGSYSLALSAKNSHVPFYVAGTLLKTCQDIETYKKVEIEKRKAFEVWHGAVRGLKIINYAFDIVPENFITGFITEFGILKPSDIKKVAVKNYKEIF